MRKNTPLQQAMTYAMQPYDKPKGRPKTTWLKMMDQQLKDTLNINIAEALEIAKNKEI